jgi:nucleotide-binding universal stress UspA family protein
VVPLKDILVHVDDSAASPGRLRLACELARRHAAHLAALYCIEPLPMVAYSAFGDPGYTDFSATEEIKQRYRAAALAAMGRAEAAFRAEPDRAGIDTEWRVSEGAGAAPIIEQARCTDLTVLGQTDPGRALSSNALPEEVVLASGRPALIVPAVGRFERVGRRVLVAWNASREAARALGDALPLLVDAQAVTVLSVGSSATIDNEHRGADVTRHLARHGITATAAASIAKDADVGDVLLSRAADHGADLIVMGAYGHSRTREWLLGGATRHLLRHMTVPVLMAH